MPGTTVYWIRRCIHNRSDTLALNILRILAGAMYEESRLFIVEEVKGSPPSVQTAAMDVLISAWGAGSGAGMTGSGLQLGLV